MKKDFSLSNMNDWMRKHLFFTGLIFFAIYGVIHGFDMWPETASSFPFVLGQIICVGLIMVWIISVRWRIVRTSIRREIIIMGFLMILWFLLRFSRYRAFFGDGDIRRYFWYCYYIPQMIVPVITFLLAMRIGLPYKSKLNSGWNILFVIAVILILAVLTNDIHQLVFTFPEGTVWGSDQVKRGPLYFAAIIWLFSLMVMAVMVLFFKSRVHKSKQDIWKPLFVILFAIIYGAWYIHGPFFLPHRPIEITEAFCFFFIIIVELCINIGVFPSNIKYEKCFEASTFSAQIVDVNGKAVYSSKNYQQANEAQLKEAIEKSVMIDNNTRLRSNQIDGGRIYWTENLEFINSLRKKLAETATQLENYNELLKEMHQLKRHRERIKVKSHLYDTISEKVAPQMTVIEDMFNKTLPEDEGLRSKLAYACVLNSYIKRRSNLIILAENKKELPLDELYLSIRESVDYLKIYGIYAAFASEHSGSFSSDIIGTAYEIFETVVETVLFEVESMMVNLKSKGDTLLMRIAIEGMELDFKSIDMSSVVSCGGEYFFEREGNTCYISLKFIDGRNSEC